MSLKAIPFGGVNGERGNTGGKQEIKVSSTAVRKQTEGSRRGQKDGLTTAVVRHEREKRANSTSSF